MITDRSGIAFGRRIDIHHHFSAPGTMPADDEMSQSVRLAGHYGIAKVVTLGDVPRIDDVPNQSPKVIRAANDYTLAAMARWPDHCIGFCFLNPENPVDFLMEEMDRCLVAGGMRGVKLWAAVNAIDSRNDPIMERLSTLGAPVLYHAWYNMTGSYIWHESTSADIANLARRFPQVPIIMAHLGGCRERGVLDIVDTPNVLVDTSGSQPETNLVEYAVNQLGPQRVIYGSDWPVRDYAVQLGRVLGARLRPEDLDFVLHRNATRVLGLGGD